MERLRMELERHANEQFCLARWKIASVAVFIITGLGWYPGMNEKPGTLTGVLILHFTGFLCAYIDSLYYRRGSATHAIASVMRNCSGKGEEVETERKYERFVKKLRDEKRYFLADYILQFISTIVFTIGSAVIGYIAYNSTKEYNSWLLTIPGAALAINIVMFVVYEAKRRYFIDLKREVVE